MRWLAMLTLMLAVVAGCREEQSAPPPPFDVRERIDETHKQALVEKIAAEFERSYVYPEQGNAIARSLRNSYESGEYRDITSPLWFGYALSEDLQKASADPHIVVYYGMARRENPLHDTNGFERVDRLSGNLGYIKIGVFSELDKFERAADAALLLLKDTEALIIDLRGTPGGSVGSVAYLISYFLGSAEPRLLRTMHFRKGPPIEIWSRTVHGTYVNKPVYVLVSRNTASAAEAFAFDMKALHLARLVGERTSGGANAPMKVILDKDYWMLMSVAHTTSPGFNGDWERFGVIPDIPVTAEAALVAAISHYVDGAVARAPDAAHRQMLQRVKDRALESGEAAFLLYKPPRTYVPVRRH